MVKGFRDSSPKPSTCGKLNLVQPLPLTNEESEARKVRALGFFVLFCFSKDLACVWVRQGTGPSSISLPETQPRALSTSHKHISP